MDDMKEYIDDILYNIEDEIKNIRYNGEKITFHKIHQIETWINELKETMKHL